MPVNTPKREQRYTVTPDPVHADNDDNFISMKQLLSSKMQKTLILRLVLMSNNILCQKLMIR